MYRWQELTFLFGQCKEKQVVCQEKMAEIVITTKGECDDVMIEVRADKEIKLHTNNGTRINFVTSTSPLSVIFSSQFLPSPRGPDSIL